MNTLRLQLHLRPSNLTHQTLDSPVIIAITPKCRLRNYSSVVNSKPTTNKRHINRPLKQELVSLKSNRFSDIEEWSAENSDEHSRIFILGALSLGVALMLMGFDDQRAQALGPEGPLMEEFWDNMRRYALYALTVSTGAIYVLVQPILELLKNPISAVLILAIIGGSIFIVSQVVTAMVGLSDFSYDYSY